MEWTKEQSQAIYEKGNNILVAAGAGSGKTAVLVERIINKIINEKIDIDKILVVTFTNASASEMRERILDAIYKKLEETPDDTNLQRQITLLSKASISTIHSFCLEVVRNNFYELENISPNFRIAETTEIELIKQEVMEEMFEEKYENQDKNFEKLIRTYTSYKDDTPLKEIIDSIYEYIQSSPFPEEWLTKKIEMFNLENQLDQDFSKTIWGQVLIEEIEEIIIEDITRLQEVEKSLLQDPDLEGYQKVIANDIETLNALKMSLSSWDKAYNCFLDFDMARWSGARKESELKEKAKSVRDIIKSNYKGEKSKIKKILNAPSQEINEEIYDMYKILVKLKDLIFEFSERFAKAKREKNIVDFHDIEHLALKILINGDSEESFTPSEVAKKYAQKFQEIAIDEYQDSNLVQEYILSSVSNSKNMFMVGDVKQSIYKFRQAMPEIFLGKYRDYKLKENKGEEDDLKILLYKNFRSRQNVLDTVNIIFEKIMSNVLGDIEYNEEEFLNLGASYKENGQNLKTEVNVITMEEDDEDEEQEERLEKIEIEAKFVARKIKNLIDSKFQIYDNKLQEFRNIKYKDIVILLRSPSTSSHIYEQEILKYGMPVFSDTGGNYLDTIEIETIISLLKIIDNPLNDIPLISVMRSPIGNFTDNELVEIRLCDKYSSFYKCMQKAKVQVGKELSKKIEKFFASLDMWRKEQEYLALDELIWKIYTDTGYFDFVETMPNGSQRKANLKLLFEKAKQYEGASFKGLYNFIRFIEKLKISKGDMSPAKIIGENDDVIRIMSIHKSKGLEFPVVFLSSMGKEFNLMDLRKKILLHQEMGIGVKYIDYDNQVEFDTLTKEAIKNKMLTEILSEEMRVLYVGLTRAKEKLIITGTKNDYEKDSKKLDDLTDLYPMKGKKVNPILVKKFKTYLDWILLCIKYGAEALDLKVLTKGEVLSKVDTEEVKESKVPQIKNEIPKLKYKYELATKIPTKTSVSKIKQGEESFDVEFKEPKFMRQNEEEKITGAKKGTLVHLCLQKLNEKQEYDLDKVKELIKSLESKNLITAKEAEAINPNLILNFTKSKIWTELKTAKVVEKEKPFYINVFASEIYEEKGEEEKVLVQGVIDLYYETEEGEVVLIDYKTDYVEDENDLIDKYKVQLELYKRALEAALKKKVSRCYIYSTYKNKEVRVDGI